MLNECCKLWIQSGRAGILSWNNTSFLCTISLAGLEYCTYRPTTWLLPCRLAILLGPLLLSTKPSIWVEPLWMRVRLGLQGYLSILHYNFTCTPRHGVYVCCIALCYLWWPHKTWMCLLCISKIHVIALLMYAVCLLVINYVPAWVSQGSFCLLVINYVPAWVS